MKNKWLPLIAAAFVLGNAHADSHPWFDIRLTDEARIEALLDAMTVEEKIGQLLDKSPGIDRLGILPYGWWNEALHGVARNGWATVFPQTIALAATFDDDLVGRIGTAISDEARAKFNAAQSMQNYGRYAGLTFFSPNVNIFRDPRWGRGMETYGEDPYLQARMGTAYVRGMQGDDPTRLKTAACAKHYAVHSGPEALRHVFNAVPPRRDLYETYLPAFEATVKAGVECVMCAYNAVDGDPSCSSDFLLQDLLREQWDFQGHVVSDCWGIDDFHTHYKVTQDPAESAALALKTGTDLNCGPTYLALPEALERGLVAEADIDTALRRLLATKMKLGIFDEATPWDTYSDERVESAAHVSMAREAAQKSIVLLKNNGILPLRKDIKRLFIVGPYAADGVTLLGNYHGLSRNMVTFIEGIMGAVSAGTSTEFRYGQRPLVKNLNPRDHVTPNVKRSDATIAVVGISSLIEGEEGAALASDSAGDRLDLDLPEVQLEFLRKLRAGHDKPLIVVLVGGSPITSMPEIEELADAVLFAWYPGQQGGNAVADIIFGDVNPSGRLPITFPVSLDQLPPFEDYSMEGRTYKYMTEAPMYPFGYGLSYTRFTYGKPKPSATRVSAGDSLDVKVSVRNDGDINSDEVVQLYLTAEDAPFDVPRATLVGFSRIHLESGAAQDVSFTIAAEQMQVFDAEGKRQFAPGSYTLHVGGVSPGDRGEELTGAPLQTARIELRSPSP